MDAGRWSRGSGRRTLRSRPTHSATCAQETTPMSSTPALVLVGLVLVLLSIPLAFSLGPIVLGGFLLVLGYRRATASLEAPAATPA